MNKTQAAVAARRIGQGIHFARVRRMTGYLVGTLDCCNNAKRAKERNRVKQGIETAQKGKSKTQPTKPEWETQRAPSSVSPMPKMRR